MTVERINVIGADGKVDRDRWLQLRKADVTASVVGALFGVHPYTTALEVYHEKNGLDVDDIDNAVLRRGRLLEGAVAVAVEEERPDWKITKATDYFRDPDVRIGATPDFFVAGDPRGMGVIQAKTVAPSAFKKSWSDGVPFWISLQCVVEMMLTGAAWGAVAALVVDPWKMGCHVYEVPRHPGVEARIVEAVRKFWTDFEFGVEPAVDYARDGDLIAVLNATEVAGKVIDLTGDNMLPVILAERVQLKQQVHVAQKRLIEIDNEVKSKMGDAEVAQLGDWTLTFRTQSRKGFVVKPTTFRKLNVTDNRPNQEDPDDGPF